VSDQPDAAPDEPTLVTPPPPPTTEPPPVHAGEVPAPDPVVNPGASSAPAGDSPIDTVNAIVDERPEALVGAALAGGFLAAMILKRLGR
jgi:hypothetical protein